MVYSRHVFDLKKYILIGLCIVLSGLCGNKACASHTFSGSEANGMPVDTILNRVILYAPFYEKIVGEYTADLYIKAKADIKKKNLILRFVPFMFDMDKGVRQYIMESHSELHYTAPNIYDQKVKACSGTVKKYKGVNADILDFFHVNVYSSDLLNKKLLSPLQNDARKYYTYSIDSILHDADNVNYKISFVPKWPSYQLVEGYFIVTDKVWSVREMLFTGRSEYRLFTNHIEMGKIGDDDEFLPVACKVDTRFRFLGNVVVTNYNAALHYKDIKYQQIQHQLGKQKKMYDLTESYTLQCDTNSFFTDKNYFQKMRPLSLNANEEKIYNDYDLRKDSLQNKQSFKNNKWSFFGNAGDALISNYYIDLSNLGMVKCSPILNPFLLSYSATDGLSYKQEFKYNRYLKGDRLLRIVPKVGYNFKRKELYWSANTDFDYWPAKRAAVHLQIGNGNRIYSSDVLDELKDIPDSIFNFNKVELNYFRDLYATFSHSLEVFNGFTLNLGVSAHRRTAVNPAAFAPIDSLHPGGDSKIKSKYKSFAPRIRLEWTPGQYYYMNGKRKVNLHSDYPSVSLDWERGVKGVLGSTGKYERWEFDVQHQRSLGLMKSVYWRLGGGMFTEQEELYFVDFVKFGKNNLPVGWNDDIGGVFQLLDRRWYNSSNKYVRANFTYEAPFLVLPHIVRYTRNVLNERLYFGALLVPHLMPYLELGYGIGTHIFDLGVFVSNVNGRFSQIGCKFTFELFNR